MIEIILSPELKEKAKALSQWEGWCRCDNQETGLIVERGHTCDVYCKNCGGVLQIG